MSFCFSTLPPSPQLYPLSLHDALPISWPVLPFGSMRANATAHATPDRMSTIVREWYQQKCANRERPRGRSRFAQDRKSTRLNSSHVSISYAVFCLKKKKKTRG